MAHISLFRKDFNTMAWAIIYYSSRIRCKGVGIDPCCTINTYIPFAKKAALSKNHHPAAGAGPRAGESFLFPSPSPVESKAAAAEAGGAQ